MKYPVTVIPVILFAAAQACCGFDTISGDLKLEWEERGYIFPTVQYFPVQELSDDGSIPEVAFGGVETGFDSLNVYLIGLTGETPVLLASGEYLGRFNFTKSWAYFEEEEGTVEIGFQMPGSAQWYSADYLWDFQSGDLILVRYESGDPSLDAISEIDSLLATGEIAGAERVLEEMFYPQNYYVEGEMYCLFLRAVHREAVRLCLRGDSTGAVELFTHLPWGGPDWDGEGFAAEAYRDAGIEEYMTLDEFNSIAEDYREIENSSMTDIPLRDILAFERLLHPSMNEKDAFKLVSQAAFGGDHLLRDRVRFERGLATEWESLPPGDGGPVPPLQLIDPRGCTARIHLVPLRSAGIELPDLVQFLAGQELKCGDHADFDVLWRAVPEAVNGWDPPMERELLESLKPSGVPSHHSSGYGFAAYRICNDIVSGRNRAWLMERDLYPGDQVTETK